MPAYQYEIGGVPLDDPWGRWSLHPDSVVLPHVGSLSVTSYRAPGQQGETQSVLAPRDPVDLPLTVTFYPIDGGSTPVTESGRKDALERNMQLFLQAVRAAAQEGLGLLRLYQKHQDSSLDRRTGARLVSGSTPVVEGAFALARVTYLFRIPSGVWVDPVLTERSWTVPAGQAFWGQLPIGAAGLEDLLFAVQGRQDGKSQAILVRNSAHIGFQLVVDVPAGQWLILNTASWAYALRPSLEWDATKTLTAGLYGYGRGVGKALSIVPAPTLGLGSVSFRVPNGGTVALRGRKAWY